VLVSSSPEASPPPPDAGSGHCADAGTIPHDLRTAAVFAVDLVAVVVFVLLGRSSHGKEEVLAGVLVTLWPFLTGMLVGWLVVLVAGLRQLGYPAGVVLVVCTVGLGMVLRNTVSHDGTPPSFVIAASTFLTILYLGWRAVAALVSRRRAA
jgi:hypothetical protein